MKVTKMRALLMLLLTVGVVFSSCKQDDGSKVLTPTIVFNNTGGALISNTSLEIGTTISFNVVFTKGNDGKKLKTVRLTRNTGDGSFTAVPSSNVTPAPSNLTTYAASGSIDVDGDTYTVSISGLTSTTTGTHVYRFYVEDKDGNNAQREITITWTGPQNNVVAPAAANNVTVNTSTSSFLCLTCVSAGGAIVRDLATANSNAGLIDLRYFYSTTFSTQNLISAHVLATSTYDGTAAEWDNAVNNTEMRMLTSFDAAAFDTVANQTTLQSMFDQAGTSGRVTFSGNPDGARFGGTPFVNNAVVLFRTQGNKYGAFKVTSTAANSATLNIKIQN